MKDTKPIRISMQIFSLLFLICLASCKQKNTLQTENSEKISASVSPDNELMFKRSNLVVSDLDRSLKIYRDILGFEPFSEIEESTEDSYSYPVFKIPKSAKIRFLAVNSKTQERTLAFTEVKGVELPKPGIPLMSAIVIRVENVASIMNKIESLGLETTKMKTVESPRVNYKEQAFVDFDGHLIVIYETF